MNNEQILNYTISEKQPSRKRKTSKDVYYHYTSDGSLVAKTCTSCGVDKTVTEFSYDRRNSTGLQGQCRSCVKGTLKSLIDKDPYYFRDKSTEYRDKHRARTKSEIAETRKKLRPLGTKRCTECGEFKPLSAYSNYRGFSDGLQARCKPCVTDYDKGRRSRTQESYWVSRNIPLVCYICGDPYSDSDHVVPRKLQGIDDLPNRLPICRKHNRSKNAYPLYYWLRKFNPDIMEEVLYRVINEYKVNPNTSMDLLVIVDDTCAPKVKLNVSSKPYIQYTDITDNFLPTRHRNWVEHVRSKGKSRGIPPMRTNRHPNHADTQEHSHN